MTRDKPRSRPDERIRCANCWWFSEHFPANKLASSDAVGAAAKARTLKPLKLDRLSAAMAESVEAAKANDPKELKKEVARLKRELAAQTPVIDEKAVERAVSKAEKARDRYWQGELEQVSKDRRWAYDRLEQIARLCEANGDPALVIRFKDADKKQPPRREPPKVSTAKYSKTDTNYSKNHSGDLAKGEATILTALIQFPDGLAREQLTVLTGYKRSSRDTYLQRLREKGLVKTIGGHAVATDQGQTALLDAEPLPTGDELQRYWLDRLPAGERAILEVLLQEYPSFVTRDHLSEATGYKRSSRDTYLQRMRAKQLVTVDADGIRASDTLF